MNAVLDEIEVEETEVGGCDDGCGDCCVDCDDEPISSVVFLEYRPFATVAYHSQDVNDDGEDMAIDVAEFTADICSGEFGTVGNGDDGKPLADIKSVQINPTPELIDELYEQLDDRLRGTGIRVVILPVGSRIAAVSNTVRK